MIIWRGYGILVGLLSFAIMVATEHIVETSFEDELYYQITSWPIILAFTISGIVTYPIGLSLNKHGNQHSLFFIPIQYLIIAFPIIGLALGLSK